MKILKGFQTLFEKKYIINFHNNLSRGKDCSKHKDE